MYCSRLRLVGVALPGALGQLVAVEGDRAGPVLVQAADRAGDGGLAAARLAHQGHDLGLGEVEGHVVDDLLAAVEDAETVDREDDLARLVGVGVGHRAAGDVPGADLLGADAAHVVVGRDGSELGHRLLAGVDDERAAVVEAAAARTGAGGRGAAGDAGERTRLAQVRDRVEQRPGVGVRGVLEHRIPRAQLDDLAGVHHRHPVGDVGDDGEVVGHVERADPVGLAELGHRLEDHRLRGHVEARSSARRAPAPWAWAGRPSPARRAAPGLPRAGGRSG